MIFNSTLFRSVLFSLLLAGSFACQDDAPEDPTAGEILIVNEGNFGGGNGSLSLYDRETQTVSNGIFAAANDGREVGGSIQSVTKNNNRLYLITNLSDKIEVVDAATYGAIQAPLEDEELVSPRYMAVAGDKAYVTVWGAFDENFALTNSKVAVIDLNSFTVNQYIPTAAGPEGIAATGDRIFVANSFTDTLTVISAETDEIVEKLKLDGSPQWLAVDENNKLWVSVTGAAEQFLRINPQTLDIEAAIDVDGSGSNGKFAINNDLDKIYFIGTEPFPSAVSRIYELTVQGTSAQTEVLINGVSFYGIGVDEVTDNIYVGNSNSFQGEGTLLQYDEMGILLNTFAVGVGPNGFVFE